MNNLVYITAAGSGKTTTLVRKACALSPSEYVLILTYTDSNEKEIRNKFYQEKGYIPQNVCIQSWFSFLLQHLIKPYQNHLTDDAFEIKGLAMEHNADNGSKRVYRIPKSNWKHYYFSKQQKALTEKLSELAYDCNEKANGKAIQRLCDIYDNIYIDEVQDLAGYDLELIKLFFLSKSNVIIAGDPRQTIYLTNHNGNKNIGYRNGKILAYLSAQKELNNNYQVDTETLNSSRRCCSEICEYASIITSAFNKTVSQTNYQDRICGVYLVSEGDKSRFLNQYDNSVQLRHNIKTKSIDSNYAVMNFGESKGMTFDSVLIYPTQPMIKWMENHDEKMEETSINKFYVAVTRARYLVGIVWPKDTCSATDITFWTPSV